MWGLDDATRDRAHADRWSFLDDDQYDLEGWAARPGSLGSWMQKAASPMEARYLEEFITMLDRFEKKRGLDRKRTPRRPSRARDAQHARDRRRLIHVHLGPGLHAEPHILYMPRPNRTVGSPLALPRPGIVARQNHRARSLSSRPERSDQRTGRSGSTPRQ